jgi:hypothetical protein
MSTQLSIKANKSVWEKIRKNFADQNEKKLHMGFFQEDSYGEDNNYLPVPLVAAWQDLGIPFVDGGYIPPRPFMTIGLRDLLKTTKYTKSYKKAFRDILNGSSYEKQYEVIGKKVVPDMVDIIDEWDTPPNAPSTVRIKGEDNPLVDTGKMRDSFKVKVER